MGELGRGWPLSRAGSFAGTPRVKDGLGATRRWYLGISNDASSKKVGPRNLLNREPATAAAGALTAAPSRHGAAGSPTTAAVPTPPTAREGRGGRADGAGRAAYRRQETGGGYDSGGGSSVEEEKGQETRSLAEPLHRRYNSCPERRRWPVASVERRGGAEAGEAGGIGRTAWSAGGGDAAAGGATVVVTWEGERRDAVSFSEATNEV